MSESEYSESAESESGDEPRFISAAKAAVLLDCTPREIYYKLDSGQIAWCKDGRRRKVIRASLDAYIAKLLDQPSARSAA